jgi:2,3-dihydroxybenzoate-AMP ligase
VGLTVLEAGEVSGARIFTPDGFYRSGDLMRRHPSGNNVVEGRKKDLINRGGEKISAEEVENLILSHPAVLNVACVPMPDPVVGERMCRSRSCGRSLAHAGRPRRVPRRQGPCPAQPARAIGVRRRVAASKFRKVAKSTLSRIAATLLGAAAAPGGNLT